MWSHMPVTPSLGTPRQEDPKLEASLGYMVSLHGETELLGKTLFQNKQDKQNKIPRQRTKCSLLRKRQGYV